MLHSRNSWFYCLSSSTVGINAFLFNCALTDMWVCVLMALCLCVCTTWGSLLREATPPPPRELRSMKFNPQMPGNSYLWAITHTWGRYFTVLAVSVSSQHTQRCVCANRQIRTNRVYGEQMWKTPAWDNPYKVFNPSSINTFTAPWNRCRRSFRLTFIDLYTWSCSVQALAN